MARYIDKEALLKWLERVDGCIADGTVEAPTLYKQIITDIKNFGVSDVAPESEVERLQNILDSYALQYGTVMDKHIVIERARAEEAKQVLSDLKKQVHDKATYPHNSGIDPYMSLKVFDAILNNIIKKYSEGKNE